MHSKGINGIEEGLAMFRVWCCLGGMTKPAARKGATASGRLQSHCLLLETVHFRVTVADSKGALHTWQMDACMRCWCIESSVWIRLQHA